MRTIIYVYQGQARQQSLYNYNYINVCEYPPYSQHIFKV